MKGLDQKLFKLATNFRQALLQCPTNEFSAFLRKYLHEFPKQSCDVASLLLAYYLRDCGFKEIDRIFGYLNNESHVWLEISGWIIDITADQFLEVNRDPVVVVHAMSKWYSNFVVQSREVAYPLAKARPEYEQAYLDIKSWMERNRAVRPR